MLKALEQPPSHVAFILCTTNPEKLSVTVKRRCTQFEVKPLTDQEMDGFILSALARESIAEGYPPEIVQEIVKASNGSPGIAMNILDQVIDMQDGQQIMEVIRRTVVTEASVIDLCRALLARNWNGCRAQLIAMEKVDVEKVRYAVLTYMRKVLLGDRPDLSAYLVIRYFERAFYDSGLAGLVAASWAVANRQEPKDFQF